MANEYGKKERENGQGGIIRQAGSANLYILYRWNGKQHKVSTGSPDRDVAEKMLKEKLETLRVDDRRGIRPVDDFKNLRYEDIRDSYIKDRPGKKIRGLKALDEYFENVRVIDFKQDDLIRKYIATRRKELGKNDPDDTEENHDPSIRRELVTLRAMFNQAKREGKVPDVPYFPMPDDSNPAGEYIDPPTFQKILDAFPKADAKGLRKKRTSDLKPFFTFIYSTGCRLGAAQGITWNMVSKDCTIIKIPAELMKMREPLTVVLAGKMLDPIVAMLKEMPRTDGPIFDSTNYRTEWSRAVAKAGVGMFDPKTRRRTGVRIHDCRCSAAVNLVDAGVSEDLVMKIGAWKTKAMFSRYNITNPDRIRKAMEKGGDYVAERMKGTD